MQRETVYGACITEFFPPTYTSVSSVGPFYVGPVSDNVGPIGLANTAIIGTIAIILVYLLFEGRNMYHGGD